jgi:hypothetical protein
MLWVARVQVSLNPFIFLTTPRFGRQLRQSGLMHLKASPEAALRKI